MGPVSTTALSSTGAALSPSVAGSTLYGLVVRHYRRYPFQIGVVNAFLKCNLSSPLQLISVDF